jgi:hypothetical protein
VCFGCGQELAPGAGTAVGDAMFCGACLGRLLRRGDERGAAVPGGPLAGASGSGPNGAPRTTGIAAAAAAPATAAPADAPCFVCGEPLDGDALVELRGFAICASCARGLVGEDAEVIEPAPAPAARPGSTTVRIQVTPGSATEWCSRCGRAMPGPGSYQLLDGRPHCPACVAAYGRSPAAASACEACGRSVAPASLGEIEGFELCAACRHSDPELALSLARARHHRRLARAGRRILDGEDE